MMGKKAIIAHSQKDILDEMVQTYSDQIKIVGQTTSGKELITLAIKHKPDIIISELLLRDIDSISAIKLIKKQDLHPKTIVITKFTSLNISAEAINVEIDYMLLKPVTDDVLRDKISKCIDITSDDYEDEIYENLVSEEEYIDRFLRKLGLRENIKGYEYLKYAILICQKDSNIINAITKSLYPEIAEKFDTTASGVERSIRHAIESAWIENSANMIKSLDLVCAREEKPTNSQFIGRCVKKVTVFQI